MALPLTVISSPSRFSADVLETSIRGVQTCAGCTVRVAGLLEASPLAFVKTARYCRPLDAISTAGNCSVDVVAPGNGSHPPPPGARVCQATKGAG